MNYWVFIGKLAWRIRRVYVVSVVLQVTRMSMVLVPGLIVRSVLNELTGDSDTGFNPETWILVLVGLALARFTVSYLNTATDVAVRVRSGNLLRHCILEDVLRGTSTRSLAVSPGVATNRARDDIEYVGSFLVSTTNLIGRLAFLFSALVIMGSIDASLLGYVFLPLLGVSVLIYLAGKRIEHYRRESRSSTEQVTAFLREMFNSVKAIRVASAIHTVCRYLVRLNSHRRQAALSERRFSLTLDFVSATSLNTGVAVILVLSTESIVNGSFTIGDLALFISYIDWIVGAVGHFGRFMAEYKQTGVSIDRLATLSQPSIPYNTMLYGTRIRNLDNSLSPSPLSSVEVSDISFRYGTSRSGVTDIRFRLYFGDFNVITGTVGSGKTTVLRILLGLLPITNGRIAWNGRTVKTPREFFVPPRSAYSPQDPSLYNGTLKENILMGWKAGKDELSDVLEICAFDHDLKMMKMGLETEVGTRGRKLSGGQLQRLSLARALIRFPEFLIVDDLSSSSRPRYRGFDRR